MNDDGYGAAWEAQKDEWRRGGTSAQKQMALNAKATLEYIKANPGCTKEEIKEAGIQTNFKMLQDHRLAYFVKADKARWYARN
jgi:hypothetical protein